MKAKATETKAAETKAGETEASFRMVNAAPSTELSILPGMRLREVPPEVGTREQVFRRYGLDPPT
ncbi:MAG: hypothetical protein HY321_18220 [Armatimonadetes bacterium]|nr:hypothetical protein [Armatimonadota bacterium]